MRGLLLAALLVLAAAQVAGELHSVQYARAYVNNIKVEDIDSSGSSFEALPSDQVKISVRVKNGYNYTISARLYFTIYELDNGDDRDETTSYYDLGAGDERTITITTDMPSNTRPEEYDARLITRFNVNGTQKDITYNFVVDATSAQGSAYESYSSYKNMTNLCSAAIDQSSDMLGVINRTWMYQERWSLCEAEKQGLIEREKTCLKQYNQTEDERDKLRSERDNLQSVATSLTAQVNTMLTTQQCEEQKDEATKQAKSAWQTQLVWIGLLLAGGGYYFFYRKRKIEPSVQVKAPFRG